MEGSGNSDSKWLLEAQRLAECAAALEEVPVGAVIVLGDRIVGQGHNRREIEQSPIAHAEIQAILDASRHLGSWRLTGCILFVTLEPCPMCLAACQQARLARVVYGARDPKGGALSLGYELHADPRTNHRFSVEYSELPECGKILSEFFVRRRKGAT